MNCVAALQTIVRIGVAGTPQPTAGVSNDRYTGLRISTQLNL